MERLPSLPRRMLRRTWQIVVLTLVVSIALVCLILVFKQPKYEAVSLIRVEPAAPNLFATSKLHDVGGGSAVPYLRTQANLIKSDLVLNPALASPTISIIPAIRDSEDPRADLRKKLVVEAVEDAFLIRVSLESTDPQDAAAIVNAVVESYRIQNERYALSANKRLRDSLEREDMQLQNKIEAVQAKLKALVQEGRVALPAGEVVLNKNNDPNQPMFKTVDQETYRAVIAELMRTDSELIDAESNLAVIERALDASKAVPAPTSSAIKELRLKVDSLKIKKERQIKRFEQMRLVNKEAIPDTLQSNILTHDLASYQARKDNVTANLAQLQFESNQESFRIVLVDLATGPITPSNGNRLIFMAAAPAIVFCLIVALFLLLEIIAGRLARAAELSSARLRAEASDLLEGEFFPFKR
jgi:capsular polysaccharide biosynthesis protein